MKNFKLQKRDGHIVACVKDVPADSDMVVIAIHGFTSSKESPTVRLLLKRLPEAGIGVVGIDLPAHGAEESREEELRIEGCKDSVAAAEAYIEREYPGKEIAYFASSFGAYITGLYISSRPHRGRKAFFRSAAVNMPTLFIKSDPDQHDLELLAELEEKGYIQPSLDLGSPVKVTKAMFDDLARNDLFEKFDPERYGHHKFAMAHGEKDAVINPAAAARFAERFGIPITFFAGQGHSLCEDPKTPDKVVDLALKLYCS
ncbi:MAG: alpha/beta fold hydrolase [Lachnospiraceae bacterium]|nr:alpha/beta fold hydrolase [Lachnospiraceae bacterium]